MTIDQAENAGAEGVYLLFAKGKRPKRAALREFADKSSKVSVSYDPSDESPVQLVAADGENVGKSSEIRSEPHDKVWIELLREGLTFDLLGLDPGEPTDFPDVEYRFDLEREPDGFWLEPLRLIPGQHLASGAMSMPVAQGLVALARDITHHFEDLVAVVWPPSNSAIGRRFFESITTAWLEGGAFPALGLTAFRETVDGALQSVGLDFWIRQELRIEPPLSSDKVSGTRLGVRLVNQLMLVGGLEESERIVAPDGNRLVMRPSRNRKFIRVWRE